MEKDRAREKKRSALPFEVFGLHMVVRICKEPPAGKEVFCPKGGTVLYGEVVAVGDGFDADANKFRPVPQPGSFVTFEEAGEEVEGHYFYLDGTEYRVVHLDSIIVAFPPPEV